MFRQLKNPEKLSDCLTAYGRFMIRLGDSARATRLLDEAQPLLPAMPPHLVLARAELARANGHPEEAVRLADKVPPTPVGARFEATLERAAALRSLHDRDGEVAALAEAAEFAKSWQEPRLTSRLATARRGLR